MNTFLPYPSFQKSAECLDNKRLGKQRVEVLQILKALSKGPGKDKKTPWYNHPATQMWKGHERNLCAYGISCCIEWTKRGFKDSCYNKIKEISLDFPIKSISFSNWFGYNKFHASHRSNLLRKNSSHYSKFGWTEPDNLSYYWPTKEKNI